MNAREPQVCPCGTVFSALIAELEKGRGLFCSRACANKARTGKTRVDPEERRTRKRAANRGHYARNREHIRAQQAEYRRDHAEEIRAMEAAYQRAHPEVAQAAARRYRERHRERALRLQREAQARYRAGEGYRAYNAARGRARRLGATELGREYIEVLRGDPCCYCGAPGEHIDHIMPVRVGGDGDWQNLTAACRWCNLSKHHKPMLLWLLERS